MRAVSPDENRTIAGAFIGAVVAAAVLYAGVRGGSFDLVVRQQEAIVVLVALAGAAMVGLIPRARPRRAFIAAIVLLTFLGVWTGISVIWSESSANTLAEVARIILFIGVVAAFGVSVDRVYWRHVAGGLAVGAVGICVIAVASRTLGDVLPADVVAEAFDTDRLTYPLDYWNALAAWGGMSLALALAWSAHARSTWIRALALAATPICIASIYLAYSRAGVADVLIALIVVVALSRYRWVAATHALAAALTSGLVILVVRSETAIAEGTSTIGAGSVLAALAGAAAICAGVAIVTGRSRLSDVRLSPRNARIAVGVIGAAAAIAVLALAVLKGDEAWESFTTPAPETAAPPGDPAARLGDLNGDRYLIWDSSLEAFSSEPLIGVGAGSFEFWWNVEGGRQFLVDAHSVYIEQLAELGIPGLLLVVSFLLLLLVAGIGARKSATQSSSVGIQAGLLGAFAVFLAHAGVDWIWETTAVACLGLASAALAASLGTPVARSVALRWRIGFAVLAAVGVLILLPGLVSTSLVRESQESLRGQDPVSAMRAATDAVETQPWAAFPYVQRALVAESVGDLNAARRDLRLAAEREPENWRHQLLLARVEAEAGDVDAALDAFRAARRLRPESAFFATP